MIVIIPFGAVALGGIMQDLLYQFCAAYLKTEPVSNEYIIENCTRVFIIDGQAIPFDVALRGLHGVGDFYDSALFSRSNTKGQDSIHFQQLRAFTLAKQLLACALLLKGRDSTLRIAVVGAGFAGLTAALTILKEHAVSVKIDVFEHHRDVMPRFSGAYGRRVYPYHHLHFPGDAISLRQSEDADWNCPLRGGTEVEVGGIEGVLSWRPGRIESIIDQVKSHVKTEIATYEEMGRLKLRLSTKVQDVRPSFYADDKVELDWIDFVAVRDDRVSIDSSIDISLDEINENQSYHAVILAPGGMRDSVSLIGQSNSEYWNPARLQNYAPRQGKHEVAIIGGGNSAASEAFNFLLSDHNFTFLLSTISSWSRDGSFEGKSLFEIDYSGGVSLDKFKQALTSEAWGHLGSLFATKLVRSGVVNSRDMVSVTLLARDGEFAFSEMNPTNKFLILVLWKLGFIKIRNLYEEFGVDRSVPLSQAYRISVLEDELILQFGSENTVLGAVQPGPGRGWSHISNCAGPKRRYQEVFGKGGALVHDERNRFLYRVVEVGGEKEKQITTRDILLEKQRILLTA